MSDKPNDLDLVSTADLLHELCRRCDHAIFAGLQVTGPNSPYRCLVHSVGNPHTCAGLAADISSFVLRKTRKRKNNDSNP